MSHILIKPADDGYVVEVHDVNGIFYLVALDLIDACKMVLSLLENMEDKHSCFSKITFQQALRDK